MTERLEKPCLDHGATGDYLGYGREWHKGKTQLSHRVSYCAANNLEIAEIAGLVVRHACDNPRCVEPLHLLLGTTLDNVRDRIRRGRFINPPRLTMEQVREIRRLYVPGGSARGTYSSTGQAALGRQFGVSGALIRKIVNYETYKENS